MADCHEDLFAWVLTRLEGIVFNESTFRGQDFRALVLTKHMADTEAQRAWGGYSAAVRRA